MEDLRGLQSMVGGFEFAEAVRAFYRGFVEKNDALQAAWEAAGSPGTPGRVSRIDRGWSSVMRAATDTDPMRVRNLYAAAI